MKTKIVYNDGSLLELENYAFPSFEGSFIQIITIGTVMDVKEAVWLNTKEIRSITLNT